MVDFQPMSLQESRNGVGHWISVPKVTPLTLAGFGWGAGLYDFSSLFSAINQEVWDEIFGYLRSDSISPRLPIELAI